MAQHVKVAVFGCGRWGGNIVRNLADLDALAAVVDPTAAGRIRAEKIAPGVRVLEAPEAILEDPEIDAVMIATPAQTHFELASLCLAAGKDVFVEKPLTFELSAAAELATQAERAGRILMVGHLLEYHPAILKIEELLRSGALGTLRYIVSQRLDSSPARTEQSAVWAFGPHDVSVILRLVASRPSEAAATAGSWVVPGEPDVVSANLAFDGGVHAQVLLSWLHPVKERKLWVAGSERTVSYDDVSKELVLYGAGEPPEHRSEIGPSGAGQPVAYPGAEPLQAECAHFLACVAHREKPRTDSWSALRVLEVLQAWDRSIEANGSPVRLTANRPETSHGAHGHARGTGTRRSATQSRPV